jgi:hypothetical protein
MNASFLPPRPDMGRMFEFDRPAATLTEADFSELEIKAYRWAVYTDVVVRAVEALPNARVVLYEDICEDPLAAFKDMFAWAGISWHQNCADFIEQSLQAGDDSSAYHGLIRNPKIAAQKWRQDMSAQDQRKVLQICQKSAAASLYGGFSGDLAA